MKTRIQFLPSLIIKTGLRTLLVLALSLVAVGSLQATQFGVFQKPRCNPDDYLTYQSGGSTCGSLPGGGVSLTNSSEPSRFTARESLQVTNEATLEARVKVTASAGETAPPSSIGAYLGVVVRDTNAPGLTPASGVIVDLQTNAIRLLVRAPGGDWTQCGRIEADMSSTSRVVRLARSGDFATVYLDETLVLECPVLPPPPPSPMFSPASALPTRMELGVNGGTAAGLDISYVGLSNDGAFAPGELSFEETDPPPTCPEISYRFAGTGTRGYNGDGGAATNAQVSAYFLAVGPGDVVYIADSFNYRIRRVDPVTGVITTIAGDGNNNTSGDGGQASNAQVRLPYGIRVDASGNIFFATHNRVRKITAATGIITTVAGVSAAGFSGDGGLATSAQMNTPRGIALDTAGNLFITDTINQRIRRVDAASGIITTIAGDGAQGYNGDGVVGTNASLRNPQDVAVDAAGNVFIADRDNQRIRRVDALTGIITTAVGDGTAGVAGDGGAATNARTSAPQSLLFDPQGNLFIGEEGNRRIRRVDAATGIIRTYAGNGFGGDAPNATPALSATMVRPYGLAMDSRGNLFHTDFEYGRVRYITPRVAPHCYFNFTNQLAGYWPFNETSGLSAADVSTHANHGALNNFPANDSQWVPGKVGGALNFRGPGAQDYVRVPNFPKAANAVSVAAWVWADALTQWGTIAKNWGNTLGGQFHFGQWDNDGDLSGVVQTPDGMQPFTRLGAGAPLPTGRWEHVVFVADGAHLRLYRNGVAVGAPVPYTGGLTNPPPNAALGIGAKLDDAGAAPAATNPGFWQGKIDELGLWTRALSPCEIHSLYVAGNSGLGILDPSIGDTTPPAIVCPANITVAASNDCTAAVTFNASVVDACSVACVTCTPPSGSAFAIGVTTVNCSAADACGNTNTCSFTVTVTGTIEFTLTCPAPRTNAIACLGAVPDFTGGVVAMANCPGVAVPPLTLTQSPPPGTLVGPGTHPVTLTGIAGGQTNTCATAFHVLDCCCIPLSKRAILWLPLDEPAGPVAHNLIPGSVHGGHAGGPAPNPATLIHGSLGFDGLDDYVRVPNYSGLGRNAGSFSVEAWVQRAAGDNGRRVILSRQGQVGAIPGMHGFEFLLNNGVLAVRVITPTVTQDLSSGVTVPADGQWHHVVLAFTMNSSARFHLDGPAVATVAHARTFRMDVAGDVFVGSGGPAAHSFFKGALDEVFLYSNLLTAPEVLTFWTAGAGGRCKIRCKLPWDQKFPPNATSKVLPPAQIVSLHATPLTVNWEIGTLSPLPFLTPTSGIVTIPPFGTAVLPVTVGLPPFTFRRYLWPMTVTPAVGCPILCTGLVVRGGSVAATTPPNTAVAGTNGVITTTVPLTGLTPGQPGRVIVVNMNTMMPDTNTVSLNGLPPGTPVLFSAPAPSPLPGGGGGGLVDLNLGLTIRFLEPDPVSTFVIVVEVDLDGLGEFDPIVSFDVDNTFVPPPVLRIVTVGNQRQLHWNNEGDGFGVLESASSVTGPWNPVMGGAPGYVLPLTEAQHFYRVLVP